MNKIDLAAGGLALCYLVHDGEELLTYRESSRWAFGRLSEGVALPAGLCEHGWSQLGQIKVNVSRETRATEFAK